MGLLQFLLCVSADFGLCHFGIEETISMGLLLFLLRHESSGRLNPPLHNHLISYTES